MAQAKTTVDHDEIREWVESRGGSPARVKRTGRKNDPGILRVDFPGFSGEQTLEHMDWDDWFAAFDKNKLAFLYQENVKNGHESRFSKLVARKNATSGRSGRGSSTRRGSRAATKRGTSQRGAAQRGSRSSSTAPKASAAKKRAATKRGAAGASTRSSARSSTRTGRGTTRRTGRVGSAGATRGTSRTKRARKTSRASSR